MTKLIFGNNDATTTAGSITPISTQVNVAAGSGIQFPQPGVNEEFIATLIDQLTGQLREIVHVTRVTGDTMTIVRAQEGTVAQTWPAGSIFAHLHTAGAMAAMVQGDDLASIGLTPTSQIYVGHDNSVVANQISIPDLNPPIANLLIDMVFEITIRNSITGPSNMQLAGFPSYPVIDATLQPTIGGEVIGNEKVLMAFNGAAYQLLTANATPQTATHGTLLRTSIYTRDANGTQYVSINGGPTTVVGATAFVPLPSSFTFDVDAQAGSGSGGGAHGCNNSQCSAGGGGAGGNQAEGEYTLAQVTAALPIVVIVGDGGAGANPAGPGNNGGASSFGTLLSVTGGEGGADEPATSSSYWNFSGKPGQAGDVSGCVGWNKSCEPGGGGKWAHYSCESNGHNIYGVCDTGHGGDSHHGSGGCTGQEPQSGTWGTGYKGCGYGCGSSGAWCIGTNNQCGSEKGQPGKITVKEYS